jgi:very-short-patch-repair endonuclease
VADDQQRFGPINGKQGHRRLNVPFSRARRRIGLFTSFGSIDIVPTEASAEGVHILRRYLEYAEVRGRSAVDGTASGPESDFEAEVADRLRAKNYVIDYQVGVSSYRIDLGVRHPEFPERYLVGIECDGASYHSSKSARDRDRIREEVLQSKGWNLIRVWSTDWFENAGVQTDRLVQRIEEFRKKPPFNKMEYPSLVTAHPASQDTSATDEAAAPADMRAAEASESQNEPSSPSTTEMSPEEQCFHDLNTLRDTVIRVEIDNWQPHRSILRDTMIEAFVRQKVVDPGEWFAKIPSYLRQGTSPIEKRYLGQICDIVSRLEIARPRSSDAAVPAFPIPPDGNHSPARQQLPVTNGSVPVGHKVCSSQLRL